MSDLARAIPGPNGAIVCDRTLSNFSKVKSLDCSGGPSYPPARVGRFPTKTPSPFVCAYLWHPQHCGRAAVSWTSPVLGCGSVASWPGVRVASSAPTRLPPGARGALPGGAGHPSRGARSAHPVGAFRSNFCVTAIVQILRFSAKHLILFNCQYFQTQWVRRRRCRSRFVVFRAVSGVCLETGP